MHAQETPSEGGSQKETSQTANNATGTQAETTVTDASKKNSEVCIKYVYINIVIMYEICVHAQETTTGGSATQRPSDNTPRPSSRSSRSRAESPTKVTPISDRTKSGLRKRVRMAKEQALQQIDKFLRMTMPTGEEFASLIAKIDTSKKVTPNPNLLRTHFTCTYFSHTPNILLT